MEVNMKELRGGLVTRTPGFQPNLNIRAFIIEPGDSSDDLGNERGVTKKQFHNILKKASQPIKKSEKGKS